MQTDRLAWDFGYREPDGARAAAHASIRKAFLDLAILVNDQVPISEEKSLAITKIEEGMFWANAAIARQDQPEEAK